MSKALFFGKSESVHLGDLLTHRKAEIRRILEAERPTGSAASWTGVLDFQPVFASGVTFRQSEEKLDQGRKDNSPYTKTYFSERPMIFFKSFADEVVLSGGKVGLKKSSARMIPESEVVILYNAFAEPVAVSLGNDVTAVDLEKENPLYQPYAKYFTGSTSIGPCWRFLEGDHLEEAVLSLRVERSERTLVQYEYAFQDARRSFSELGRFLFEDRNFQRGVALFYGCNRSLPPDFTLQSGDQIELRGSFLPEALMNIVK